MINQFNYTLYLRTDKIDSEGRMPLYIRFSRIDKAEPKFSMGKTFRYSKEEWDSAKGLPNDEDDSLIIENEVLRIRQEIRDFTIKGIEITIPMLKDIVKGKSQHNPQNDFFLDYYKDYIAKKKKNNLLRESTIKSHNTTMKALQEFDKNLKVKDISTQTVERFHKFLIRRRKTKGYTITENSFSHNLMQINCVIKHIESLGIPIQNPFKTGDIVTKPSARNTTYLTEQEVGKMICLLDRQDSHSLQQRVLRMFLLACASGIRISDIMKLQWDNLNFELTNGVIEFSCTKTQRRVYIPLNPMSGELLGYAAEGNIANVDLGKPLFVKMYSATTINKTLKELAKVAGIDKDITFHAARRTFATHCRNNNVPYDRIQSALGHKPQSVTDRYCQWNAYEADASAKYFEPFNMKRYTEAI